MDPTSVSPSRDLTFVTNEPGNNLRDRFNTLLTKDTHLFDCLVGYFYISGFHKIYPALENVEKVRILVGLQTDRTAYELWQRARRDGELNLSHKSTREKVSEDVLDELEKARDEQAIEVGVHKFIDWLRSEKLEIKAHPSENLHAKVYIMTFDEGDRDYVNGNFVAYTSKWGIEPVALYKDRFVSPVIELNSRYLSDNTITVFRHRPKLIVRGVSRRLCGIVDLRGAGFLVAVHAIIPIKLTWQYVLGLINSTLLNWWHRNTYYSVRIPQGSLKYPVSFFKGLPIAIPETSKAATAAALERKVQIIVERKRRDPDAKIDGLEREIDQLVYKLYGLTPQEIQIVEGASTDKTEAVKPEAA